MDELTLKNYISISSHNFPHTFSTAVIVLKPEDKATKQKRIERLWWVQTLTNWECRLASVWTRPPPPSHASVAHSGPWSSTYSSIQLGFLASSMAAVLI